MSEFSEMLTSWRRQLHMYPETAFEEHKTAAFIAEKLREIGIETVEAVGGTGVVGTLTVGSGGSAIALRADIDALNLQEQTNLPYSSKNPGKMHGCGHDGHTATLLGAAKLLSERRNFCGTVRFIFQPAEEPGKGAHAMLKDGLLDRFPFDEIYGIHNFPTIPAGKLATCRGGFNAGEDNFKIVIHGAGGHSSAPQNLNDPLVVAAEIILSLQTIVSRNVSPMETAVISCTEIYTDGARNAIPGTVTITGDTRTYSPAIQEKIENRMRELCEGICAAYHMTCDFSYTNEFAPTINNPHAVDALVKTAKAYFGADNINDDCSPSTGSEDFGAFLVDRPGCFANLGTGRPGQALIPLHNPCFDYNDECLVPGAEFLAQLVADRLPVKKG